MRAKFDVLYNTFFAFMCILFALTFCELAYEFALTYPKAAVAAVVFPAACIVLRMKLFSPKR